MQDDGFCPASRIATKILANHPFFDSPTAAVEIGRGKRFVLRIALAALKVESHGAVYLHHRRRGFIAR
jgi:hypothetical protein